MLAAQDQTCYGGRERVRLRWVPKVMQKAMAKSGVDVK